MVFCRFRFFGLGLLIERLSKSDSSIFFRGAKAGLATMNQTTPTITTECTEGAITRPVQAIAWRRNQRSCRRSCAGCSKAPLSTSILLVATSSLRIKKTSTANCLPCLNVGPATRKWRIVSEGCNQLCSPNPIRLGL